MEYIHQTTNPDTEIQAISGFYTVEKEWKLEYKDDIVLCIIGMGKIETSCCGMGGCRYALVPGYIRNWKKRNESGRQISEVEPVVDENSKKEITKILKRKELVTQINFW
ncbi:MAG: hypothetical protein J7L16_07445 [Deltaproteobacteria bacterium]|nr:hypothetical protein [Deltaproteobacteria bacterium]